MTKIARALFPIVLVATFTSAALAAPMGKAVVREYRQAIRTYPFGDPNPIAAVGRIYPYFRFDGYTDTPVDREWTVVELENDYLKLRVLPEIGGKIWSAVEKSTGRSFIYDNHVVKFRDIAMRGPWTSGGIEPNYGIIGHTPNCATPVDYQARTDADGSATVVIGVLDLLTRTPWRLEITLPADKAYFTTRSSWYNASPIEQPYYTWMNTGVKAAGNLELIYPGTHYIGHGGEVFPWPIHPGNGKNLAFYEQNDFGPYKSYHVLGRHSDFFGAYWHDDDFGMARYSTRDDKLGKKAWIWGLSRQGMIWEKLLTDTDGQYVEVQSGRLFNQAAEASTLTPFKHRGFEPHAFDEWTEYWFPVKGTKGFVAANDHGALNVVLQPGTTIRFSPLQSVSDTLEVLDGDRVVYSTRLELAPLETWSHTVEAAVPKERLRVRIGTWMDYRAAADDELSRPLESPADFDWESAQGLWLKGKEWMRQREYGQAQDALDACLKKDPNYLPALTDLAMIRFRAMDYQRAWDLARRALSIDTYDPASNYYYALASARLGKQADALDGFEVAANDPRYRAPAWTELARLHLAGARLAAAAGYARRSVEETPSNLDGWQLLAVAARCRGDRAAWSAALDRLVRADPLNHFAAFERHLLSGDEASRRALVAGIRSELPHETFLELAAWYAGAGRRSDAAQLLALAPTQAEVLYWRAYLANDRALLAQAEAASPRLVFPFRSESADVFEWAARQTAGWRPKYYLALILWSRNEMARARDLLAQCADAPDFAAFYATRSKAFEAVAPERAMADLERAAELEPREWRFGKLLAERHLADKAYNEALAIAARYYERAPDSYILGMVYAKSLLRTGRVAESAAVLARLHVLPYEGATDGRALYREAQLLLGAQAWKAGRTAEALKFVAAAREWPENLGAGKPYREDVNERLEDWLEARVRGQAAPSPFKPSTPDEERIVAAWK